MPELELKVRVQVICECGYPLDQSTPYWKSRQWGVIDVKRCPKCSDGGKPLPVTEDERGKYGSIRGEHT